MEVAQKRWLWENKSATVLWKSRENWELNFATSSFPGAVLLIKPKFWQCLTSSLKTVSKNGTPAKTSKCAFLSRNRAGQKNLSQTELNPPPQQRNTHCLLSSPH